MRPRRAALLSCLLMLTAPPLPAVAAGPELPDTPPARRLVEILERVNAGDRDAMADYATREFAPAMLKPDPGSILDFLMAQHDVNGGYDLHRVLQSSAEQITVLVQGRRVTDRWMRLVVGAEPEPPHRVSGIFLFQASAAFAEDDGSAIPPGELPGRLAGVLDRVAAEGRFSGSVCLARGDSTLLSRAWGQADRGTGAPNRPDTRFTIASLGKMFTAVAVARLVEAGRLRLDEPVGRLVPDWVAPASRSITPAQLLEHTSGLGDFLGQIPHGGGRYERLADYRAIAAADTPAFTPGTGFRYSNVGYLLLGALIEAVSGESWDRALEAKVFGPARMSSTTAYRPRRPDPGIARGYVERAGGGWAPNDSLLGGLGTPAGGGVSTTADLVAFARSLRAGRLVSPAMLDSLTTPRSDMGGTGLLYGRGFTVSRGPKGRRIWGHSGGTHGVGALLEVYEDGGWVLAVLSNTTDGAGVVGDAWRDLLRRSAPPAAAR